MKKVLMATAALSLMAGVAQADAVKVGIILGFTGPIESLTPDMAAGAELAMKEVSESGMFLDGSTIEPVRADSTCVDAAAATAAAERLITSDNVAAIMGADCSGVTTAIANNVGVPNGVVMISPSATSPALSDIEDNGFFFRTAPSDARQGDVLANVIKDKGYDNVAVTYTNNDYGKGFADAFQAAYEALGGSVAISAAHEDGKADYSAEVGALSAAGADLLVVLGYVDQGGLGIIRTSLDTGAFDTFALGDGMFGDSLIENIGDDLNGTFGTVPGSEGEGAAKLAEMLDGIADNASGPYTGESYDAAALIALAAQAAGSADRAAIQSKILDVANAPGEPIGPGELAKGLEILKNGGEIDYVGATNVELIGAGEAAGSYREYEVKDGAFETVTFR
ncbi:ABC transporter substrate-binding protein [Oceanomicrobium pacificus]|uniref:ABC transporter substrate-binding protein n=1 Tax=Oceanomicrobium pacificus TaxID=2692916 RepID=A0A6B0TY69_9RHOB|nr:ABC transporter substrate-binding protein [Oceanomicrobium pacificus]MXU63861.1 ABC transporter substrate-binding protein [Oceanomicrobium pacificus]